MSRRSDDAADRATAYDCAACGLLTTSADGTIEDVNGTFAALARRATGELVGRRFQDLLTIGSKLFHQTHWSPLLQMQGSVAEVQLELVRGDGSVVPVLVNAALRGYAGALSGAPTMPVDIAVMIAADRRRYERELLLARRQAEQLLESERRAQDARARAQAELRIAHEAFRTLAENSPDVIVRFDRNRRVAYLSPSAGRLTLRPVESFVGKEVSALGMDAEGTRAWAAAVNEAFSGSPTTITFRATAPDGTRRELQTHIVPEIDASGSVGSVLGITRDVSDLKRQQDEAQARAIVAEQLIGIVSHDLRNPLNTVQLAARLLASAELGAHARTVQRITSATARANRLIGDLLDFTQARLGGGLRVERRAVDLHALVTECVDDLRLTRPDRPLEVRFEGSGPVPADPDRVVQIVTNLANNAFAYGDVERPVTVTSRIGPVTADIEVHNHGRPIPTELQDRIFEPMERGGAEVGEGSRSVGLGLYIVRAIALAHGGRVDLRSTSDDGTTFVVRLPRREEEPSPPPGPSGAGAGNPRPHVGA